MLKVTRLIMAKGYDKETANELAMRCFDNAEMAKNGMPIEWWIEKSSPQIHRICPNPGRYDCVH